MATNRDVWLGRVRAWKTSGLSAREFGKQIGADERALWRWGSRLREAGEDLEAKPKPKRRRRRSTPKFIEIAAPVSVLEVVVGDVIVRVDASFDHVHLGRVVAALKAAE